MKDAENNGEMLQVWCGILKNDNQLISRSLEDVLVEPVRSILIPNLMK